MQTLAYRFGKFFGSLPMYARALLVLTVCAGVFWLFASGPQKTEALNTQPDATNRVVATPPKPDPKIEALNALKLENFNWHKGGFDNVMIISATLKNSSNRDVKDVEIVCTHASNSGTVIDRNKKTIFELVKAGKSVKVKEFSMGFIHSQANRSSCEIVDFVLL